MKDLGGVPKSYVKGGEGLLKFSTIQQERCKRQKKTEIERGQIQKERYMKEVKEMD